MKTFKTYLFAVLLVFAVAGCSDDSEVSSEISNDTDETAEKLSLTQSLPADAVSLDPHGSNDSPSEKVRSHIYEGLVSQDENLDIVPELSSEWEQIDDVTWQFTLREDVEFHDGSEFNAEAVKANFDRLLDSSRGSTRAFVLEMIEEVNAVDEYTVEIITEYPFSPLLGHLTHGAGDMLSKELIDEDYQHALDEAGLDITLDEYYEIREAGGSGHKEIAEQITEHTSTVVEQNPAGTGYLKYDSRTPGEQTILTGNDNYWNGDVNVADLTLKVVSEASSRIAEAETGQSDVVADVPPSDKDRITSNDDLVLNETQSVALEYIGLNTRNEYLQDKRVRQALTHAFNKQAVIDGIYNGAGTEAVSPLAPDVFGFAESLEPLEYDMEEAKRLLEEAGYEDGFTLTMMVNSDNAQRVDTAIWLQQSLEELNITLEIEQLEWGTFLEATGDGEHDLYIMSWGNSTGDPDNAMTPLVHSSRIGSPGNRAFFENDEVDRLLEEGSRESDDAVREEIYSEIQTILVEEAPLIFILHPQKYNVYSSALDGVEISPYEEFNFQNVKNKQ